MREWMRSPRRARILGWWLGLALVCGSGLLMLEPIPQGPAYHHFADQRALLGIPNFLNVISNLPFVLIGAGGSWLILRIHAQPSDCSFFLTQLSLSASY